MTSYYAQTDLAAWQSHQANYQTALALHGEQLARVEALNADAQAAWTEAHDAWVADPGDPPAPEPIEPPPLPMPPAPTAPDSAMVAVYDAREVTEPEEIETATGTALIMPPRIVLTGADGVSFALSDDDLAAGYTDTSTVSL